MVTIHVLVFLLPRDVIFFLVFPRRSGAPVARWCGTVRCGAVQDFMAVNLAHAQLRRRLVTPDRMRMVEETVGKQGAERFLDSGITGVTPGKVHTRAGVQVRV